MSAEVSDERLRQAVREVLAEELDDDAPTATRRQVLGSIAAGGVLGGVAGAGSAAGATSTVNGTPASLGTVASNVYKWADPGGLSGPYGSRNNVSSFDTGRIHIGSDTGTWSYDNGSQWQTLPIAKNHIKFSNGRVYGGRLTGSNDAQVVIDAIADRPDGEGVILQDPGFALDWEQQVDLPADEQGFSLQFDGFPTLQAPSGFSGSYMLNKPGSTASNDELTGYRIGGAHWHDPNGVVSKAIHMSDVKESVVWPSLSENLPFIEITSDNGTFSNQNKILGPYIKGNFDGTRDAGIYLSEGADGTADQNWVLWPLYNDEQNNASVAYEDDGAFNKWLWTRAEFCDTIHKMNAPCRQYYISEGGWDRIQYFRRTVEESGNAHGTIELMDGSRYEPMDLVSPSTIIRARGKHYSRGGQAIGQPVDVLEPLQGVTGAHTLGSLGLRDNSSNGGSVSIGQTAFAHPRLDWSTGGAGNGAAVMDLGDQAFKIQTIPKGAYGWGPASTGGASDDDDDVLVRHGVWTDTNNRAELIYDPTDSLAVAPTPSNWFFQVVEGGTEPAGSPVDMGIGPTSVQGDFQVAAINYISPGSAGSGPVWTASIEEDSGNGKATIPSPDNGIAQGTWRWYVEELVAATKTWRSVGRDGRRLYRT